MKGPDSYVKMLDDLLQDQDKAKEFGMPLRPSNAGTCARRIAYEFAQYLGFENGPDMSEDKEANVLRLLNLGHFVETQVVEDFKKLAPFNIKYTQQEVDIFTLNGGTRISGHTDLGVFSSLGTNGESHAGIGDVKTIGDRWDAAFSSKWEHLLHTYEQCHSAVTFGPNSFWVEDLNAFLNEIGNDDSLYKNLVQLNLYVCAPFMQERGVDHGFILRYNKNNSKLMELRFAPSQVVFQQTKARFDAIEAVAEHQDPTRVSKERMLGSLDCTYCPANKTCWPKVTKQELYAGAPSKRWATPAIDLGGQFESALKVYARMDSEIEEKQKIEKVLLQQMDAQGIYKVKLGTRVYEAKYLKSGAELRRSKE